MNTTGEQPADRFRGSAGSGGSDFPLAAQAHPGVLERTAGLFSLWLLPAQEGRQETAVLSVRGEIDLVTKPALLEALLPVIERGTATVVVDLSEVPFMDSSGVHVLVDALQRLGPQNRRLAIACREHGQVHRLLALVGLLDAVSVHRSRESAVIGGDDRLRPPTPTTVSPPRRKGAPDARIVPDDPGGTDEADPAGPTIALTMARTRDPARPAGLSPTRGLTKHQHRLPGGS